MRKAAEIFVQFRRMSNEVKSAFDSAIKEAETTPEKKPLRKDQEVTPKLPTTDGG